MSVAICSNATIDAIIHAAQMHGMMVFNYQNYITCPELLGQILADMNFKSYEYRYGIREADKYKYQYTDRKYNEAEMFGSCVCYDYQACEAPDYYESGIPVWLRQLKEEIGSRDDLEERFGKIPWGVGYLNG